MSSPSNSRPFTVIRRSPKPSESIVTAIISAIEEINGGKPVTPLYEAVDPEALEALYEHGDQRVQFQYIGYQVTIQYDRTILVSELNM